MQSNNMTRRANRVRLMRGNSKRNRTLKRSVGSRNLFATPEDIRNTAYYRNTSNTSNNMMRLRFNNNAPSNNNAKMFKNTMANAARNRYTKRNMNLLTRPVV